jgi:hypothetical protein
MRKHIYQNEIIFTKMSKHLPKCQNIYPKCENNYPKCENIYQKGPFTKRPSKIYPNLGFLV